MPITPEALNFHTSRPIQAITSSGYTIDTQKIGLGPTAPGIIVQTSDGEDSTIVKGTEATLLRFEGLPVNTTSFEIKYIFHFEGTPAINLNTVLTSA